MGAESGWNMRRSRARNPSVHWDYDSEPLFNTVLMSSFYMSASGATGGKKIALNEILKQTILEITFAVAPGNRRYQAIRLAPFSSDAL